MQLTPGRAAVLAACVVALVALGSSQQQARVLESADDEVAVENSFFDALAAKDAAKSRRHAHVPLRGAKKPVLSAKQARAEEAAFYSSMGGGRAFGAHSWPKAAHTARKPPHKPWAPMKYKQLVHAASGKGTHRSAKAHLGTKSMTGQKHRSSKTSLRADFAKAQQLLHAEQHKMRHLEEHEHVKAAEQNMKLERMQAQQQAHAYERHLHQLDDAVFPRSLDSAQASHAVSHALTDDMHEPPKATHYVSRPRHGSNRLYRRVKNSGRDFVRQVVTGKAISHSHPGRPSASASAPAPLHALRVTAEAAAKSPKAKA